MKFAIWTGGAWEDWGPNSPTTGGIGGSETAAIMVSKALVKRGHSVDLYGQFPPADEGVHDGVKYIRFDRVLDPGQIEADVFISSRDKEVLILKPNARVKALWVHDIHVGDDYKQRLPSFDKILCLTKWHRDTFMAFYPHVKKDRVVITRNGISVERYKPELSTEEVLAGKDFPMVFTYSSSPDRGLDVLLTMWPKIRRLTGENAKLNVLYGFGTWKKMSESTAKTPAMGLTTNYVNNKIAWFEDRLQQMRDQGVTFHGRVGQNEVAEMQMKSLLWLYPTDFKETSCITAMENMAAGAVPVCTGMGALSETVGDEGVLVKPFNKDPRYETDFLAAIERLVGDPAERVRLADNGRKKALGLTWDGVAAQWEQLFAASPV